MKRAILALAVLLLAATPTKMVELPESLRNYESWTLITPETYSIPEILARLCTWPDVDESSLKEYGPHAMTSVRIFANDKAKRGLHSKDLFPVGSTIIKEKYPRDGIKRHGIMIKGSKGWEFSYYPSKEGATFEGCATCHNKAQHDSVFAPYLQK